MKRDTNLFIQDILESIKDIKEFSRGLTYEKFVKDKLKQNAIIRSLEIIGESIKNIPNSVKEKYSKIPWKAIAGFRDILIHAYFSVALNKIWNVIKYDLPVLEKEIGKIKV